jgi:predicted PurR-regulated permease PerM
MIAANTIYVGTDMADTQTSKPTSPTDAGASWGLQSAFHASALGAIVVAVIYFGQPILMPAALAILLAFALEPLVMRLRSLGLGRIPSVVVTVLVTLVVIGGVGSYIASEFASLVGALPRYESNIAHKINSLRSAAEGDSMVGRVTAALDRLERDLSMTGMGARALPGTASPQHVVVDSQSRSPIGILRDVVGPLLDPLATVVIVIIFVVFILLQREDLRDRFIRLAGSRDLRRTAVALDDGASRLSRYLLMQTGINAAFGLMVGAGLWIIGIPNPGLWGLIGMMFRFVPYVGVPVAAAIPVGLAFAIDPGWSKVGWTVALYAAIEPVLGQFVEPFVYGRSIGLSATAVVAAATFWTRGWGP